MSHYVDGFVIPIKKDKVDDYKKMAELGCKVWMKHGAIGYFECVGDDLSPAMEGMKVLTFPELAGVKSKEGETVIFSFIIFKSREHRDEVNKKVMADPEMNEAPECQGEMPFDVTKMAYGGFKSIVESMK